MDGSQQPPLRTASSTASDRTVCDELAVYHHHPFDLARLDAGLRLPLPDEPFVGFWREVAADAAERGAWPALVERLPQLAFPIAAGISTTEPYRAATLRGVPVAEIPEATGLELERPESLEIVLHPSPAGHVPLLVVRHRPDFVTLLRALARRNEPVDVPAGQGALMVAGYNNWCRIAELRRRWEGLPPAERDSATWNEELNRLKSHKELYQDRFILLSDGPYSAIPAADLGLGDARWRELSLVLRRDHECAHYLTLRLYGAMRNHLLDELVADYAGLVGALGHYRADWFLHFLGVGQPDRPGRRIEIYRGTPPLGEVAFRLLEEQTRAAAENLERFDRIRGELRAPDELAWTLAVLATFPLDQLAEEGAPERLAERLEAVCAKATRSAR